MSVAVITPPTSIVDLDLVRQHLKVDGPEDDVLIATYMAAAQGMIDGPAGWLGRCIGQQTLELRLDGFASPIWGWSGTGSGLCWAGGHILLPYPPLISVISVTYEDATGASVLLPSSAYLATDEGLDAAYGTTLPSGRWEANAVRIRYLAGYVTPPPAIVAAVLLMIGDLYSNRETTLDARKSAVGSVPMSTTVEALLGPFRVWQS